LPLTVAPFLHHQLDPTMPRDRLAGLVPQHWSEEKTMK